MLPRFIAACYAALLRRRDALIVASADARAELMLLPAATAPRVPRLSMLRRAYALYRQSICRSHGAPLPLYAR